MRQPLGVRTLLAIAATVLPLTLACADDEASSGTASETSGATSQVEAPDNCVTSAEAARASVDGTPVWARFCPGPDGRTAPAEVPSDALTTHLDLLTGLAAATGEPGRGEDCRATFGRTYRVQIGYADGGVTQVSGRTDPGCPGTLLGGSDVTGPEGLGAYGAVMAAFGRQYADAFDPVVPDKPLTCPVDPRKPDSVDVDGPSSGLDTGYHLGRREPMVMPLTAVRGILCTWQHGSGDEPEVRDLTPDEAERVRIGLHAIFGAMVDCVGSPDPTHTAVVEDRTGTRRAVTIIGSECSTVVRSDDGYGLGFAWLDR